MFLWSRYKPEKVKNSHLLMLVIRRCMGYASFSAIRLSSETHLLVGVGRYHATSDSRLPTQFICFDCRLRRDVHWDLIKVDLYPQMMSKFKDIALFRCVTDGRIDLLILMIMEQESHQSCPSSAEFFVRTVHEEIWYESLLGHG